MAIGNAGFRAKSKGFGIFSAHNFYIYCFKFINEKIVRLGRC